MLGCGKQNSTKFVAARFPVFHFRESGYKGVGNKTQRISLSFVSVCNRRKKFNVNFYCVKGGITIFFVEFCKLKCKL